MTIQQDVASIMKILKSSEKKGNLTEVIDSLRQEMTDMVETIKKTKKASPENTKTVKAPKTVKTTKASPETVKTSPNYSKVTRDSLIGSIKEANKTNDRQISFKPDMSKQTLFDIAKDNQLVMKSVKFEETRKTSTPVVKSTPTVKSTPKVKPPTAAKASVKSK